MSKLTLATLALAAVAACGRGEKQDLATADSLSRDLQLAPVDTTAALSDQPAAVPAPAPAPRPAPAKKPAAAPKPRPAPAAPAPAVSEPAPAPEPAPTPRILAAGVRLSATTEAEIRSHKNKVGDQVTARVASDVRDAAGRVVIPAGSVVTLQVTAIKESENKGDDTGTLALEPSSVSINGNSYPLVASASGLQTHLEGRGTNAGDIAKVGAGTGIGAVVGRVIGGNTRGAVIGGVIGGAVGTQRAIETKDRDVVLPQGSAVTITLDGGFEP